MMPNLRKRGATVLYNEKQMSALEYKKRPAQSRTTTTDYVLHSSLSPTSKIPHVVISNDGKRFFPCPNCCRAFSNPDQLTIHYNSCSFSAPSQGGAADQQLSPPPLKLSPKMRMSNAIEVKVEERSPRARPKKAGPKGREVAEDGAERVDEVVVAGEQDEGFITTANGKTYFLPKQFLLVDDDEEEEKEVGGAKKRKRNATKTARRKIVHRGTTTCNYCKVTFEDGIELLRHKRAEHSFPRVFVSSNDLEKYNEEFLKTDRKQCVLCGRPLGKMNWKRHLSTHSNERNFECRICKKTFARVDHRNAHEDRHIMSVEDAMCE